ncbi:MAG: hypothetical protein M3296_03885, partial [Actinomycetota bacterium]|nr:hypothetical protein [Actinomycetota bacterium]
MAEGTFRVETIHLDLPAVVGALSQRLHAAGVPVTPERSANFAKALTLVKPVSRRRLYWTARAVFVSAHVHLAAFDRVFAAVFTRYPGADDEVPADEEAPDRESTPTERPKTREDKSPPESGGDQDPRDMGGGSSSQDDDDEGEEVLIPIAQASDDEVLSEKSFAELEPDELAALYKLMTRLRLATPLRRTRRARHGRRGEQLDMRRTLRAS